MEARLQKQVRAKKAMLTRSLTELDALIIEEKSREEVKVYLDSVKQKKATLTESYEKLLAEVSEETLETELESWAQLEALERSSLGRAQNYLKSSQPSVVLPNLEPVKMLPFDGDPCAYPEFIAAFKVLVANNPNMSAMEKMLRLKDKLRGAALNAIGGLAFSEADYVSALLILERRFGGRDRLIQDSLKRLRALQGLSSSGSAHGLREFADAVTSSLNKLRNIGDTSNIYSDTLLREVVAKLSSKDRDAFFEMCVSSEQACNLVTLEPWLQRRAEASLLSETYRKSQPTADSRRSDEAVGRTNQSPRKRTFAVKISASCSICKNGDLHNYSKLSELLPLMSESGVMTMGGRLQKADRPVLAEIESLLNSPPLTYPSSDPRVDSSLAPNHLLVGQIDSALASQLQEKKLLFQDGDGATLREFSARHGRDFCEKCSPISTGCTSGTT
ncbi:uncharacterized protein LOC122386713 [Amphibalanus amphitrite]|uniref:uncharacterized protein LOC122386713 n=1 Tax=Amphibalanus amphitrite TaxID=1232801 RepID=UPI001C916C3E|nr:uncharacterized protein LOC122386713 [Amphibalanus amphitrite]